MRSILDRVMKTLVAPTKFSDEAKAQLIVDVKEARDAADSLLPLELSAPVARLFSKSFKDIGYDWDKLTGAEKKCISEPEFRQLCKWFRARL